jgi:hypothetical protein
MGETLAGRQTTGVIGPSLQSRAIARAVQLSHPERPSSRRLSGVALAIRQRRGLFSTLTKSLGQLAPRYLACCIACQLCHLLAVRSVFLKFLCEIHRDTWEPARRERPELLPIAAVRGARPQAEWQSKHAKTNAFGRSLTPRLRPNTPASRGGGLGVAGRSHCQCRVMDICSPAKERNASWLFLSLDRMTYDAPRRSTEPRGAFPVARLTAARHAREATRPIVNFAVT